MARARGLKRLSIAWIRELAEPYLRGYRARSERAGSLRGYWFTLPAPGVRSARDGKRASAESVGFFAGYLVGEEGFSYLAPAPPECVVFASVQPLGGAAHRRLVRQPESLVRRTFGYIRWLTHRPPRFAFYEDQLTALVRHVSMREWPRAKYEHFSGNFFIETLAWLVRSGLVRMLREEGSRGKLAAAVLEDSRPREKSRSRSGRASR